jgi:cellulose synthase/poly-beta-1,6-N-acetylglucosamine synthase-like glycosyltransferase
MNIVFNFSLLCFVISCIAYILLITYYFFGWNKAVEINNDRTCQINVSVVVAAKNESSSIEALLHCLVHQNYNSHFIEIVVIDDHSTDETYSIIESFAEIHTQLKLIRASGQGKKAAIAEGIKNSNGELIITTDADCTMGNDWIQSIVTFYIQTNAQLISAPVCFINEDSLFEKMQSLEFLTLIGSGAGAMNKGKAIMCNGANLCFSRNAFYAVNGYDNIEKLATGDDVLLMYKIKKAFPNDVYFLKSKNSIVFTQAKKTINEFINQRKRWASKPLKLLNSETLVTAWTVFLTHFFLLLTIITLPFANVCFCSDFSIFSVFCLLVILKLTLDFSFTVSITAFFDKKKLIPYFFILIFIYPIYIVFTPLLSLTRSYHWK